MISIILRGFGLAGILSIVFAGCGQRQLQLNSVEAVKDSVKDIKDDKILWQEISLPIFAQALVVHDDHIILVGEEGFATLNQSGQVTKYPPLKIQRNFVTDDGGLTRKLTQPIKQFPGDEKSYPYVCEPESIAFMSGNFYVYSNCEHSFQLWKATFDKKNTLLNLTDFTYSKESIDEVIFGPTGLSVSNDKIILSFDMEKGPALLTEDNKTGNLRVLWQGKDDDGGIVLVDFVGNQGWMLLAGGKLLRSSDGGDTWENFSNIPPKTVYNLIDLKFRNANDGYIIGKNGLFLSTVDGGKTWESQDNGITTDLYKIAIDENTVGACCSDSGLLVSQKGTNKWATIEKPEGNVRELLLYNNSLYALIDGKMSIFFRKM